MSTKNTYCRNCNYYFHWCSSCDCDGYHERGFCCVECMGDWCDVLEARVAELEKLMEDANGLANEQ